MKDKEVGFEIVKEIVVLREGKNGWTQELNLVRWYDNEPKYDLRWWSKNKNKSGKGITLRQDELESLMSSVINHFENGQDYFVNNK